MDGFGYRTHLTPPNLPTPRTTPDPLPACPPPQVSDTAHPTTTPRIRAPVRHSVGTRCHFRTPRLRPLPLFACLAFGLYLVYLWFKTVYRPATGYITFYRVLCGLAPQRFCAHTRRCRALRLACNDLPLPTALPGALPPPPLLLPGFIWRDNLPCRPRPPPVPPPADPRPSRRRLHASHPHPLTTHGRCHGSAVNVPSTNLPPFYLTALHYLTPHYGCIHYWVTRWITYDLRGVHSAGCARRL